MVRPAGIEPAAFGFGGQFNPTRQTNQTQSIRKLLRKLKRLPSHSLGIERPRAKRFRSLSRTLFGQSFGQRFPTASKTSNHRDVRRARRRYERRRASRSWDGPCRVRWCVSGGQGDAHRASLRVPLAPLCYAGASAALARSESIVLSWEMARSGEMVLSRDQARSVCLVLSEGMARLRHMALSQLTARSPSMVRFGQSARGDSRPLGPDRPPENQPDRRPRGMRVRVPCASRAMLVERREGLLCSSCSRS